MRRFAPVVLFAIVFALGAPSPASAASPIHPDNRPTPLDGFVNGEVPVTELIFAAPGCRLGRAAGPSMWRLLRMGAAAAVRYQDLGCYRPLARQVTIGAQTRAAGRSACAAQPVVRDGKVVGTSYHGWGKAVDFDDQGGALRFTSRGYAFLKAHGARVGWNHPGWAEPNGSACPEPWHWEWVGDGGRMGLDPIRADAMALLPAKDDAGYAVVGGLGGVVHRGSSTDKGSVASIPLQWVVTTGARTPSGDGYWLVGGDGGVFSLGDAGFFGSTGDIRLNSPIIAMAPTPSGQGYWLVAADGGVFTFGDAAFHGSTGDRVLNLPVVGFAPTPTGKGYWLVAADGGMFSFGDAAFHGSTGDIRLNSPVVGMAPTTSGDGYWLVAEDGGVFNFGGAGFVGSAGGDRPAAASPIVSLARTSTGKGYWMLAADGSVLPFGDARFFMNG